jgi:integrase
VTSLDIETYRAARLKAGVKKSTTNREIALLKKMFHLAIDWGYCADNPVLKVKLFSEKDNLKERVLSEAEETRFLANCTEHLIPIVVFALNTGMRKNEILALMWEQIDRKGKVVRVTKTKSGKDRFVPLNEVAVGVIEAQCSKATGKFVFPSTKGGESFKAVRKSFEGACRRAGISGLRFHDLRHTFATRLIQRGADIVTVQNLLGHHSVTITQRYTHSGLDRKRYAVDLLASKALEMGQKPEDLLHSRDMGPLKKETVPVTRSYLVN